MRQCRQLLRARWLCCHVLYAPTSTVAHGFRLSAIQCAARHTDAAAATTFPGLGPFPSKVLASPLRQVHRQHVHTSALLLKRHDHDDDRDDESDLIVLTRNARGRSKRKPRATVSNRAAALRSQLEDGHLGDDSEADVSNGDEHGDAWDDEAEVPDEDDWDDDDEDDDFEDEDDIHDETESEGKDGSDESGLRVTQRLVGATALEFDDEQPSNTTDPQEDNRPRRVTVIQPRFSKRRLQGSQSADQAEEEAVALCEALDGCVCLSSIQTPLKRMNKQFMFGTGKVKALKKELSKFPHCISDTIVVNTLLLSPRQEESLRKTFGRPVFDRFRLILDIFRSRAHTREAKLQVELAAIAYQRARLVLGKTAGYDRQRGGLGAMAGAGETQLEKMRRKLRTRETAIRKELADIKNKREVARRDRTRTGVPIVVVVGYTNAGKTALTRLLTHNQDLVPEDRLFASLDTTARLTKLPKGTQAIVIDTVGFVSDLPHQLVDAFAAMLEDVKLSDVIVHVTDASDQNAPSQQECVKETLREVVDESAIECRIQVFNKADKLSQTQRRDTPSDALLTSAVTEEGIEQLQELIEREIKHRRGIKDVVLEFDASKLHRILDWLYSHCSVHDIEYSDNGQRASVRASFEQAAWSNFKQYSKKRGIPFSVNLDEIGHADSSTEEQSSSPDMDTDTDTNTSRATPTESPHGFLDDLVSSGVVGRLGQRRK